MECRRIEVQIRAVLVPFRIEARRRDSVTMQHFRTRAHSLLDMLDGHAVTHPDLVTHLAEARQEVDGALDPSAPPVHHDGA